MKHILKNAFTESDNETFCVIRILGCVGVVLVGTAIFVGAAPLEVGAGVGAIITAIGGGVRLKGEQNEAVDTHK